MARRALLSLFPPFSICLSTSSCRYPFLHSYVERAVAAAVLWLDRVQPPSKNRSNSSSEAVQHCKS
ncbi:unnamed protein product, partial [Linum tenue]